MESIEREFVSYEIAVQMKKLGFKDICFGYYNNHPARSNNPRGLVIGKEIYGVFQDHNEETEGDDLVCSAPTYSQCFKWFENKGLFSYIYPNGNIGYKKGSFLESLTHRYMILQEDKDAIECPIKFKLVTKQEAELALLKKLIELCQNQI